MTTRSLKAPSWLQVPAPDEAGHKHDRGRAIIVSGPMFSTGAARLAAMGALRIGAGLVTIACERSAALVNAQQLTAIMLEPFEDPLSLTQLLSDRQADCVAIGMGLGRERKTKLQVLAAMVAHRAIVLDADALSVFEDEPDALFGAIEAPTVLTPHEGEFERLFGKLKERERQAELAAKAAGSVIVLKGPRTVVAAPDGRVHTNDHASRWLATAGSGDVLAGMICGLVAQGLEAFEAARTAVWLHGDAGVRGGPGLIAEDLPRLLPAVLKDALDRER